MASGPQFGNSTTVRCGILNLVLLEVRLRRQDVVDEAAEEGDVRARADGDVLMRDRGGPRVPRIDVDERGSCSLIERQPRIARRAGEATRIDRVRRRASSLQVDQERGGSLLPGSIRGHPCNPWLPFIQRQDPRSSAIRGPAVTRRQENARAMQVVTRPAVAAGVPRQRPKMP